MQQYQQYLSSQQFQSWQQPAATTVNSIQGLPSSGAYPSGIVTSSGLSAFPSTASGLPSSTINGKSMTALPAQMPTQYSVTAPATATSVSVAAPSVAVPIQSISPNVISKPAGTAELGKPESVTAKVMSTPIAVSSLRGASLSSAEFAKPPESGSAKVISTPVAMSSSRGVPQPVSSVTSGDAGTARMTSSREQALEQKVRDLELQLHSKEKTIQELQGAIAAAKSNSNQKENAKNKAQVRSPGRNGSGFRKTSQSKPTSRYTASDHDDPIDVRLEEFYNSTGSAIPFRRINRGFYRFGDTIVEVDIINHKLMARTEDGWNRGKFGPVEKFLMYYENIEREKAGILPES